MTEEFANKQVSSDSEEQQDAYSPMGEIYRMFATVFAGYMFPGLIFLGGANVMAVSEDASSLRWFLSLVGYLIMFLSALPALMIFSFLKKHGEYRQEFLAFSVGLAMFMILYVPIVVFLIWDLYATLFKA